MAAGEAIGCFGLTVPDYGSNPAGMRTRARRDRGDWVLSANKMMWITNGSIADVAAVWARVDDPAGDRIRGFVVPTDTPGFSAPEIKKSARPSGVRRCTERLSVDHSPQSARPVDACR